MAQRSFFKFFLVVSFTTAVTSQAYRTLLRETISIASQQYPIDPADVVLAGYTVSAGGHAVTIGGAVVSEYKNGNVFADGIEVLTGLSNSAKTAPSGLSHSTTESKLYHMIYGLKHP